MHRAWEMPVSKPARECELAVLASQAHICMLNWSHPAFGVRSSRLEPNSPGLGCRLLLGPSSGSLSLPRRRCRAFLLRFDDHCLLVSDATEGLGGFLSFWSSLGKPIRARKTQHKTSGVRWWGKHVVSASGVRCNPAEPLLLVILDTALPLQDLLHATLSPSVGLAESVAKSSKSIKTASKPSRVRGVFTRKQFGRLCRRTRGRGCAPAT